MKFLPLLFITIFSISIFSYALVEEKKIKEFIDKTSEQSEKFFMKLGEKGKTVEKLRDTFLDTMDKISPQIGHFLCHRCITPGRVKDIYAKYGSIIEQKSNVYGVDPAFVIAIIFQESGGNPNVIGPPTKYGRAYGLMQLLLSTASSHCGIYSADLLLNPVYNIDCGVKYISIIQKHPKCPTLEYVARGYFGGPGRCQLDLAQSTSDGKGNTNIYRSSDYGTNVMANYIKIKEILSAKS